MLDSTKVTANEWNKVFHIIELAIYPDRCPGIADPRVIRATSKVFRALGLDDEAAK